MHESVTAMTRLLRRYLAEGLSMEDEALVALDTLRGSACSAGVRTVLDRHVVTTHQQIAGLEQAFLLLGDKPSRVPGLAGGQRLDQDRALAAAAHDTDPDHVVVLAALSGTRSEASAYAAWATAAELAGSGDLHALAVEHWRQEMQACTALAELARGPLGRQPSAGGGMGARSWGTDDPWQP